MVGPRLVVVAAALQSPCWWLGPCAGGAGALAACCSRSGCHRWPCLGPARSMNRPWAKALPCFLLGPAAVTRHASFTFLEASSNLLSVAQVAGPGSGMKISLCASFNDDGVCGCQSLHEGFVEALLLSCRSISRFLAGVAPCCTVPACASSYSTLWSVQLGWMMLP